MHIKRSVVLITKSFVGIDVDSNSVSPHLKAQEVIELISAPATPKRVPSQPGRQAMDTAEMLLCKQESITSAQRCNNPPEVSFEGAQTFRQLFRLVQALGPSDLGVSVFCDYAFERNACKLIGKEPTSDGLQPTSNTFS